MRRNRLQLAMFPTFISFRGHVTNRSFEYPGEKNQLFQWTGEDIQGSSLPHTLMYLNTNYELQLSVK
jgi:hypothetical protein